MLAVKRPLLIGVLNLLIVIAGIAALIGVEVRELPNVDRPIVSVTASLPGAAPETVGHGTHPRTVALVAPATVAAPA